MNKKISQKKRDFLIEIMQGTKENPNLKYTREKILEIGTASELAEILGITRQTMSRLESCTTKLSAAQYLAICGIIEKKKNEILYDIKDSKDKGKSIMKLFDMSFYFEPSFLGTILQDDIFDIYITSKNDLEIEEKLDNISIKEEYLNKLSRMTCMDKWLSTFEIHESISQEELFSKGCNIIIFDRLRNKNTIQGIVKTMRAFTKYSNNDMKTYLYLDYNGVLSFFKNAISYFEKNISIANNFIEFTTNFLLLYKNNKIQFLTDNHYTTDLTFIFGALNKAQLKWIKHILDTDEDATYIYAGNKDRSEFLSINDVCAHVTKSKIKNGKLVCEIEFDYTDPGLKLFRNWQNGFAPKLNLNTIFVYDEKDPNLQNLKFLCLEFV